MPGPGFIVSRFLNSLVAYRTPTPFQESTQAVVFSAVMIPMWLLAARPLLASRAALLAAWNDPQHATPLPWWAIWMPVLVFAAVYFIVAPMVALIWAFFVRRRPHIRAAEWALGRIGSA